MSAADLLALSPWLVLSAAILVVMLAVAFGGAHRTVAWFTALGLILTVAALVPASRAGPRQVTALLVVDRYALFFSALMLAAALAITVFAYGYFALRPGAPTHPAQRHGNFHLLLLLATLGATVLTGASHFASLLLGFEILSVALFALVAFPVTERGAVEAAAKYLVLGGVSSAFLLFGMALVYMEVGSLEFTAVASAIEARGAGGYALAGLALTAVGIGFKLSAVPFHMWTPDVYQGAPAPTGAFIATVSKGAVAALLLRYLVDTGAYGTVPVTTLLATAAFASMLAGNLLALFQENLKRVLAYSSIAHLGYLLVAIVAGGPIAAETVGFYLAGYFATMLGVFGVIATVSAGAPREWDRIEDYRGLAHAHPALAAVLVLSLLSLAGIPLTAGFVAKFYVLVAGVSATLWWLVAAVVAGSAIALFYYLRIIAALFARPGAAPLPRATVSTAPAWMLALLATLMVGLGTYPEPLARTLRLQVAPVARFAGPEVVPSGDQAVSAAEAARGDTAAASRK